MLTTTSHHAFTIPIDNQIDGITVNGQRLIEDLLQSDRSIIEVAGKHKLTPQQLLVWCDQPAVRAFLEEMDKFAIRRANHKATQIRHGAIQVLEEQAMAYHETPRDREMASKAARALLRLKIGGIQPEPAAKPPESQRVSEIKASLPTQPKPRSSGRTPPSSTPPAPNSLRIPVYRFILNHNTHNPEVPYQVVEAMRPSKPEHNDKADDYTSGAT